MEVPESETPACSQTTNGESKKSISLPQIFKLLVQVAVFVWFAATMRRYDRRQSAIQGPNGPMERMTRMEEQSKSSQESLDRIAVILATPPSDGKRH